MSDIKAEPVAWIRRWALDGEKPAKELKENGRWAWPAKFKFIPVSLSKCMPADEALYTADAIRAAALAAAPEQADKRDAARYRHMRDKTGWTLISAEGLTRVAFRLPVAVTSTHDDPDDLDAAIDAAMKGPT